MFSSPRNYGTPEATNSPPNNALDNTLLSSPQTVADTDLAESGMAAWCTVFGA